MRQFTRSLAVCLFAVAGIVGDAGAQSPQAIRDQAFDAMMKAPGDVEAALRYATLSVQAGDYEAAIGALERQLIFDPDQPRIFLELGVVYYRLGSYEAARTYLDRVAASGRASPEVAELVRSYQAEIDKRSLTHRFSGQAVAGLRHQSNANFSPNGGDVRFFGLDARLDRPYRRKSDQDLFGSVTGQYVYDPGLQNGMNVEVNLASYAAFQRQVTELNLAFLEVDAGPRFRLGGGPDGTTIRPYVLGNTALLDSTSYFSTGGAGVSLRAPLIDALQLDAALEARARYFNDSSRRPTASDRDGVLTIGRAGLRYALTPDQVIGGMVELVRDAADAAWEQNWQARLAADYTIRFSSPLWLTNHPWVFQVGASRTWRNYDGANPIVDPRVEREDREWLVGLSLAVGLTADISWLFQVQHTSAESNLPNYEYDNTSALTAIAVRF